MNGRQSRGSRATRPCPRARPTAPRRAGTRADDRTSVAARRTSVRGSPRSGGPARRIGRTAARRRDATDAARPEPRWRDPTDAGATEPTPARPEPTPVPAVERPRPTTVDTAQPDGDYDRPEPVVNPPPVPAAPTVVQVVTERTPPRPPAAPQRPGGPVPTRERADPDRLDRLSARAPERRGPDQYRAGRGARGLRAPGVRDHRRPQ